MTYTLHLGDCLDILKTLPDGMAQCCVTSPPYFGLRDYGVTGQIGLEKTPEEYVAKMVGVFSEVRRVLADDGTLWLNIGDSYAANRGYQVEQTKGGPKHGPAQGVSGRSQKAADYGLKPKDLIGIPWMLAFALRADGWYLRQDIIWHKPNPMPESVRDRCTKAHEYIFLLSKSQKYFFDSEAMKEKGSGRIAGNKRPTDRRMTSIEMAAEGHGIFAAQQRPCETRNHRSVWSVATRPYKGAHFATFPPALIEPCILAGSRPGDIVLDPFAGSFTTGQVAMENGRVPVGIDINPDYLGLGQARIAHAARKPQQLDMAV